MAGYSFIIALVAELQLRYTQRRSTIFATQQGHLRTHRQDVLHIEASSRARSYDSFPGSMRVCIIIERLLPEEPSFGSFGLKLSLDGMATWRSGTPEQPSPPSLKWASSLVPKVLGQIKGLYLVEFGYLLNVYPDNLSDLMRTPSFVQSPEHTAAHLGRQAHAIGSSPMFGMPEKRLRPCAMYFVTITSTDAYGTNAELPTKGNISLHGFDNSWASIAVWMHDVQAQVMGYLS
ncbi:uncharacterized protein F5147DRAFT_657019 [Suillus discolor]|uniref:Uncharacterized protein n=1 Tax=Suillus discolor TaxID=1912936 RepID=A0A9P7JPJ3_9AGAM|nr:uncharacterized protein F5147DRAFT_657019 [Suillus discolor]KAG2095140.1 hypothetical protein F5147DRAFT_657019 [Suillus discolor]